MWYVIAALYAAVAGVTYAVSPPGNGALTGVAVQVGVFACLVAVLWWAYRELMGALLSGLAVAWVLVSLLPVDPAVTACVYGALTIGVACVVAASETGHKVLGATSPGR